MKFKWLIISFILTLFLFSSTQAVWLSKDGFMQQYSTKFINGFPRNTNRRAVMKHRCDAITDPSTTNQKKDIVQWFVYASGTYTSPNQSVLAYLICTPFLSSVQIKDRFDKKLINTISTLNEKDYINILGNSWSKLCPVITAGNNLNDCDLMDINNKIIVTILNDLTNIRHGTSRWYMTKNAEDIWYIMAQYFTLGSWSNNSGRILDANRQLCDSSGISYFGTWEPWKCGFPTTYTLIINNAQIGKEILQKTTILNWEKLLQHTCEDPENTVNLLWCGINDHSSTQPYSNMMYNELWFYQQFLAMYESTASLSSTFLVGNKMGLWREWQNQLLNRIKVNSQHQSYLITNATQVSINLISQFESIYPLHIWIKAIEEISSSAVTKYIKPLQASIKFWMIDRLNTQIKDNTAKGVTQ